MSYHGLGFTLTSGANLVGAGLAPAASAGSSAGYPVAARNDIVTAMRNAALVLRGRSGTATSAQVIAGQDATRLTNTANWIAALRPDSNGMIPSAPLVTLIRGLLSARPALQSGIDAQLMFRNLPTLAPRLRTLTAAPVAARTITTTAAFIPGGTKTPQQQSAEQQTAAANAANAAAQQGAPPAEQAAAANTAAAQVAEQQKVEEQQAQDTSSTKAGEQSASDANRYADPQADLTALDPDSATFDSSTLQVTPTVVATSRAGIMAKLDTLGPLGVKWKFWSVGGVVAVAAGGYYLTTRKKVTPNRKRLR